MTIIVKALEKIGDRSRLSFPTISVNLKALAFRCFWQGLIPKLAVRNFEAQIFKFQFTLVSVNIDPHIGNPIS